jgi:hypothetical protein
MSEPPFVGKSGSLANGRFASKAVVPAPSALCLLCAKSGHSISALWGPASRRPPSANPQSNLAPQDFYISSGGRKVSYFTLSAGIANGANALAPGFVPLSLE